MKPAALQGIRARRLCWVLVCCLWLPGCSLTRPLEPVSVLAPEITLSADAAWPEVDWSIKVQRPSTDRLRDSDRLFVRVAGSRLQAYPGTVWLDRTPDMVQGLTIQALQDSGRFPGVGRAGQLRARFSLATEIWRFDAVDDGGADLSVTLEMQVNLVAQRSGQVVASRRFESRQRSVGRQRDPLMAAFEQALSDYFNDLLPWLLAQGQWAVDREMDAPASPAGSRDR